MRLSRHRRKPALPSRVLAAAAALAVLAAGFVPGALMASAATLRPPAALAPDRPPRPALPLPAAPRTVPVRAYTVRAGDTLSAVAWRLCGHVNDWTDIYAASRRVIGADPDLILPGQQLAVVCHDPPALLALSRAPARRAAVRATARGGSYGHPYFCGDGDGDGWDMPCPALHRRAALPARRSVRPAAVVSYGIYSYAALERLWESAGGPAWAAAHAAEIAGCESGGNPRAYNPSGATGLWQILGQVVGGNLYDPFVNALNAVAKFRASGDTFAQWVCR